MSRGRKGEPPSRPCHGQRESLFPYARPRGGRTVPGGWVRRAAGCRRQLRRAGWIPLPGRDQGQAHPDSGRGDLRPDRIGRAGEPVLPVLGIRSCSPRQSLWQVVSPSCSINPPTASKSFLAGIAGAGRSVRPDDPPSGQPPRQRRRRDFWRTWVCTSLHRFR